MRWRKIILIIIFLSLKLFAYNSYTLIGTSGDSDATAYNNSHKMIVKGDYGDSIHVVYHSSDTIFYTYSKDLGATWSTPFGIDGGKYPALDIGSFKFKHVAYQKFDTVSGTYDIYYDCLDDYCAPVNISESEENSVLPDVVVDSTLKAHIVWQEEVGDKELIYYRSCKSGSLSSVFQVSDYGSSSATYSGASIGIFRPGKRIYVVWDCIDPECYSPYQIHCRHKDESWSSTNILDAHYLKKRNSSVDFSHGMDSLSACWEDSSSGNLEAFFYRGNGGGYPTVGQSGYPVMSTIFHTWSYLFWEEDSLGKKDIYLHLYYNGSWYDSGSLRDHLSIEEPVRFPASCGAYLIWTQGDSPPYEIYFTNFGYPIGCEEEDTDDDSFRVYFNKEKCGWDIVFRVNEQSAEFYEDNTIEVNVINIMGSVVKEFNNVNPSEDGTYRLHWKSRMDNGRKAPSGNYFCILKCGDKVYSSKLFIVR